VHYDVFLLKPPCFLSVMPFSGQAAKTASDHIQTRCCDLLKPLTILFGMFSDLYDDLSTSEHLLCNLCPLLIGSQYATKRRVRVGADDVRHSARFSIKSRGKCPYMVGLNCVRVPKSTPMCCF
jgi:hypothetical protein